MSKHNSTKVLRVCEICGVSFWTPRSEVLRKGGRFCSPKCAVINRTIPLEHRFFLYVGKKQPNGCIPWVGHLMDNGYGQIRTKIGDKTRVVLAHRASYELMVGPIPDGLFVLHRCDNPPCINPVHLFLGTHQDNADDKVRKNRQATGATQAGRAKLTDEQVRQIRSRYRRGYGNKLAKEFGIDESGVSRIVHKLSYRFVE